jgi:hypothetical protein
MAGAGVSGGDWVVERFAKRVWRAWSWDGPWGSVGV